MAEPKPKKHKPYYCDLCEGWLRDQDVVGRRGRADKHRTWAVMRNMKSGDIVVNREEITVCLKCASLRRPEQFIRRNAESLVVWFNEQKKGGQQ